MPGEKRKHEVSDDTEVSENEFPAEKKHKKKKTKPRVRLNRGARSMARLDPGLWDIMSDVCVNAGQSRGILRVKSVMYLQPCGFFVAKDDATAARQRTLIDYLQSRDPLDDYDHYNDYTNVLAAVDALYGNALFKSSTYWSEENAIAILHYVMRRKLYTSEDEIEQDTSKPLNTFGKFYPSSKFVDKYEISIDTQFLFHHVDAEVRSGYDDTAFASSIVD